MDVPKASVITRANLLLFTFLIGCDVFFDTFENFSNFACLAMVRELIRRFKLRRNIVVVVKSNRISRSRYLRLVVSLYIM